MSPVFELTPRGRGGISVLAVTGEGGAERVEALAGKLPRGAGPHLVRLAQEGADGAREELDEALVWRRPDGAIEVHLHGSPVLVGRVSELLGGRSSEAGGGFLGGRSRLERAAACALESAQSLPAARMLLAQAEGQLRGALEHWLELKDGPARRALAAELEEAGRVARWLVEPPRVVIAGPVNAGKSTLFNLLVGAERVVVSDHEGTTRDLIQERALLAGYSVELLDTAGERVASGAAAAVESAGQVQARRAGAEADLILWVARGEVPPEFGPPTVEFLGRADEPLDQPVGAAAPIAPEPDPAQAVERVEAAFLAALDLPGPGELEALVKGPAPFDPATRQLVAKLRAAPELEATRQAVLALLS